MGHPGAPSRWWLFLVIQHVSFLARVLSGFNKRIFLFLSRVFFSWNPSTTGQQEKRSAFTDPLAFHNFSFVFRHYPTSFQVDSHVFLSPFPLLSFKSLIMGNFKHAQCRLVQRTLVYLSAIISLWHCVSWCFWFVNVGDLFSGHLRGHVAGSIWPFLSWGVCVRDTLPWVSSLSSLGHIQYESRKCSVISSSHYSISNTVSLCSTLSPYMQHAGFTLCFVSERERATDRNRDTERETFTERKRDRIHIQT
jgi:hypothetical protein